MKTISLKAAPLRALPGIAEIQASVVEDEAGLWALEAEWNALFADRGRASLCASHAWVCAWWEAFGENPHGAGKGTRLFVVVVRNTIGELVGVAPFFEERASGPLRIRRLRILGFLGHDGVFDMTEEPTLLVRRGWESRVLSEVASALRPGLESGRWDAAYFRAHADGEGLCLQAAFGPLRGCASLKTDARSGSDYAELPETWAEYRKRLTKSMRDNLGYYPRLLTRDGHDWHVRTIRDPDEMAGAAERLALLHRTRAQSDRGVLHDDHIAGPAQAAFLACLLRRMAAEGSGFVAELVVAGEVVASQAFLEDGDQMMVYYSGFREEWSRYSPVFVIDASVFRDGLERGVRRLDFLRNPAPWKTRWLAEPGPKMHRATLVSRRPASRVRYAVFAARQAVRRNVTDRLPILRRRLVVALERGRSRALVAALPLVNRLSPALHWTAAHHRVLLQVPLRRH